MFKTKVLARWLRKSGLSDKALCEAILEMNRGLIDGELGGHVFKKRLAMPGRGKRGGARFLVATNLSDRWFFLYGFEKNERENIDDRELKAIQKLAEVLLRFDPKELSIALERGELLEICDDKKPTVK